MKRELSAEISSFVKLKFGAKKDISEDPVSNTNQEEKKTSSIKNKQLFCLEDMGIKCSFFSKHLYSLSLHPSHILNGDLKPVRVWIMAG